MNHPNHSSLFRQIRMPVYFRYPIGPNGQWTVHPEKPITENSAIGTFRPTRCTLLTFTTHHHSIQLFLINFNDPGRPWRHQLLHPRRGSPLLLQYFIHTVRLQPWCHIQHLYTQGTSMPSYSYAHKTKNLPPWRVTRRDHHPDTSPLALSRNHPHQIATFIRG